MLVSNLLQSHLILIWHNLMANKNCAGIPGKLGLLPLCNVFWSDKPRLHLAIKNNSLVSLSHKWWCNSYYSVVLALTVIIMLQGKWFHCHWCLPFNTDSYPQSLSYLSVHEQVTWHATWYMFVAITGRSCHKYNFCCNKTFVTTSTCLLRQTHVCRNKTCLLSWQKYACCDKTLEWQTI